MIATHALAKTLSGDLSTPLTVKVGNPGYDPETSTLYLPQMLGENLSPHENTVLVGFLSHESAERGMSTWKPSDPRWVEKPDLRNLVHALNDVRINRLQVAEYPGAGLAFDYIEQTLWDVYGVGPAQTPVVELAAAILHLAQGRSVLDLARQRPAALEALETGRRDLDLPTMTATEEACIAGAMLLYARFANIEPPSLGTQNRDNASQNGNDQGGNSPDAARTSAPKKSKKPSHDPVRDITKPSATQDSASRHKGVDGFSDRALALLTSSVSSRTLAGGQVRVYCWDPTQDTVTVTPRSGKPMTGIATVEREGAILGLALQRVLVTPFPIVTRHLEHGRLDRRKVALVPTGSRALMHRRVRRELPKVALGLSLDLSQSVKEHMGLVRQAAGILAYAAHQARMPLDITGWSGVSGTFAPHIYRQIALRLQVIAPFDTPPRDAYDRLLGTETVLFTPTAEGVQFSAARLARRSEPRKVLFVVTDGKPSIAARGDAAIHHAYLTTVLGRCAKAGIEVVTLGVGDEAEALKPLFPHWMHVADFTHLGRELADALTTVARRIAQG